jgi:predicted ATP-binding protein involved in virulence
VHTFTREGGRWLNSLDNLLVWLKWVDDGRFKRAKDIINERVFSGTLKHLKGVRKDPPEAIIVSEGQEHRLDQLSSGEKSLVQMFLRIGTHMTRNTILLIDEIDVHLHTKWQHRLLDQLKQMAKAHPGLTVIVSTHSREILERYQYDAEEEGLRKGGHIIEEDD